MDAYDLQQAVRPLVQFIDDSPIGTSAARAALLEERDDADKTRAYETLHAVLLRLCRSPRPSCRSSRKRSTATCARRACPNPCTLRFPAARRPRRDEALEARWPRCRKSSASPASSAPTSTSRCASPSPPSTSSAATKPSSISSARGGHRRRRAQRQGSPLRPRRNRAGGTLRQGQLQGPRFQARGLMKKAVAAVRAFTPRRFRRCWTAVPSRSSSTASPSRSSPPTS